MLSIVIALALFAALTALIVNTTRCDIKEFATEYKELVQVIFTKSTLREAKVAIKEALREGWEALRVILFWLSIPFVLVIYPFYMVFKFTKLAYTK